MTTSGCESAVACLPRAVAGGIVGPMASLEDILRERLLLRPEVQEAYLFGSQARGEASAHSDVDVAVYVDAARAVGGTWGYDAELASELMAALGRNDVDVVVLNDAPPLLYHRVLRDGVRLLSRDELATAAREGYAVSRSCDWVPQQQKIDAAFSARIKDGEFGT
jgi:predicted nucleotidyltransferase